MKPSTEKLDVFISYSRRDYVDENKVVVPNNVISIIKDAFAKANISYWFDEDGIYSGDAWAEKLAARIDECSVFLFVSSENSNKSDWTSKEIATAHMFGKKIIPFRVDESVYNKSVIIYISNLDFIDYYTNQSLAIERLVDSVSKYIKEEKENAEKRREKKRQEEETLKKMAEAEQHALITDVEDACSDIDDYEMKSVHTRKKATTKVKKVKSADERRRLTALIQASGSISAELQVLQEEKQNLTKEVSDLNAQISATLKENEQMISDIAAAKETITANEHLSEHYQEEIASLKKQCASLDGKGKKGSLGIGYIITYVVTVIILGFFIVIAIIAYVAESENSSYWYDSAQEYKASIESISTVTPLIITDIKMGNIFKDGTVETEYGDELKESTTMYLKPKVYYIGLDYKSEVELKYKLFSPDGTMSRNSTTSPEGYTTSSECSISKGDDHVLFISGWGNENKGNWNAGTYRIEVWYKDMCLKSKTFTIHK